MRERERERWSEKKVAGNIYSDSGTDGDGDDISIATTVKQHGASICLILWNTQRVQFQLEVGTADWLVGWLAHSPVSFSVCVLLCTSDRCIRTVSKSVCGIAIALRQWVHTPNHTTSHSQHMKLKWTKEKKSESKIGIINVCAFFCFRFRLEWIGIVAHLCIIIHLSIHPSTQRSVAIPLLRILHRCCCCCQLLQSLRLLLLLLPLNTVTWNRSSTHFSIHLVSRQQPNSTKPRSDLSVGYACSRSNCVPECV